MSVGDQEVMSEESEDDGAGESPEEMTYRRKYQMLLERCEVLQQVREKSKFSVTLKRINRIF